MKRASKDAGGTTKKGVKMQLHSPRWPPVAARRSRLKYAPIAYQLGAPMVPQLEGKRFYHFVFPALTLASLQTLETMITTDRAFWFVGLLGQDTSALAPSGFRLQFADQGIFPNRSDRHFFQNKGVNQTQAVQVMTDPNWMIHPHLIPASHPVAIRVNNLDTAANVVTVSMFGYVDALLPSEVDDAGIPSNPATNRNLPPNLGVRF